MASRLHSSEERKIPTLNFKLKFFINFSISTTQKLAMDYQLFCGNNDETVSQNLRRIFFKKLGIKDQKEFDRIFIEESNFVKDKIKSKMKSKNGYKGDAWLSVMIEEEIKKEMGKNAK